MKIEILSKNFKLDRDTENYIETKINNLENKIGCKYKDKSICKFRIGQDSASKKTGNIFFAEATIETPKKSFGARAEAYSTYEAIDELKDELYKKIRRYKDKKESYIKKTGRRTKEFLKKFLN